LIRKLHIIIICLTAILNLLCTTLTAQEVESVHWLTFEQLEDSLALRSKKVFIDFYTDWCTYCRKMDKKVFTDKEVINRLNESYYAVRMDAESIDTVRFEGQYFINNEVGKKRNPLHQLAQLLALRDGKFVAPTMIVLDETFNVQNRYFWYLDRKKLMNALE